MCAVMCLAFGRFLPCNHTQTHARSCCRLWAKHVCMCAGDARYYVEAHDALFHVFFFFLFSLALNWIPFDMTVLARFARNGCDKNDFPRWIYFFALRVAHTVATFFSSILFMCSIHGRKVSEKGTTTKHSEVEKGKKEVTQSVCVLR